MELQILDLFRSQREHEVVALGVWRNLRDQSDEGR
jgi:hypothetical protein